MDFDKLTTRLSTKAMDNYEKTALARTELEAKKEKLEALRSALELRKALFARLAEVIKKYPDAKHPNVSRPIYVTDIRVDMDLPNTTIINRRLYASVMVNKDDPTYYSVAYQLAVLQRDIDVGYFEDTCPSRLESTGGESYGSVFAGNEVYETDFVRHSDGKRIFKITDAESLCEKDDDAMLEFADKHLADIQAEIAMLEGALEPIENTIANVEFSILTFEQGDKSL
jgi:hypothetical protein